MHSGVLITYLPLCNLISRTSGCGAAVSAEQVMVPIKQNISFVTTLLTISTSLHLATFLLPLFSMLWLRLALIGSCTRLIILMRILKRLLNGGIEFLFLLQIS